MPERLRRLDYTFQQLPIYFVTACTHQREKILDSIDIHTPCSVRKRRSRARGMAGRIRPDARSLPCICCDRRSTTGSLRLDEVLEEAFSKVLRVHNVPSPHWQKGPLITFCAVGNPTRRNGIMFVRIRYVPDWVTDWREWPFLGEVFDLEFRDDRF